MFGVSKMPVHDACGLNDGLGMAGVPEALKDYRPSGQIWRSDELGSVMRLHYLLTRYVGLERTEGIGGGRTCRRVMTAFLWRRLFSREARERRRRDRNYRKVSSRRSHGPAIQLNLEVPKEERDRKR